MVGFDLLTLLLLLVLYIQGVFTVVVPAKPTIIRCGNKEPSAETLAVLGAVLDSERALKAENLTDISVSTYFHVVTSGNKNSSVTPSQLSRQLVQLNQDYKPFQRSFALVGSDVTVNQDWAQGHRGAEMKSALRNGTYQDLNVYFLTDLPATSPLGVCSLPADASGGPGTPVYDHDGCVVAAQSIPGGTLKNFDHGSTLVHQVGHWFGLYHLPPQEQQCLEDEDSVFTFCFHRFLVRHVARIPQLYTFFRAGK